MIDPSTVIAAYIIVGDKNSKQWVGWFTAATLITHSSAMAMLSHSSISSWMTLCLNFNLFEEGGGEEGVRLDHYHYCNFGAYRGDWYIWIHSSNWIVFVGLIRWLSSFSAFKDPPEFLIKTTVYCKSLLVKSMLITS